MVFSAIARFARKYRVIVVVFWLATAAGLYLGAPAFSDVAVTDESQFLPQDTQSAAALKLLSEKFASSPNAAASSGIIVIYNAEGLTDADMQESRDIRDWLVSSGAPSAIVKVTSVFDSDLLRQKLVSADETTMMITVDFSDSALSDETKTAVSQIREFLARYHPDINAYVTGETGLIQDLFQSVQDTVGKTTIVTIILVLVILLIIYRSPVAALLPLIAIGCSFLASMGILGFLGQAGVKFFTLIEAYLVVVIFGVGTDYCLFIVSRFREERKKSEPAEALTYSMTRIGPVIAASALTVMVAFLCLSLSRFGMNKTSGYALALGIGITLLAGLTLIPALMSLFGKFLFWPAWASKPRGEGRFSWAKIGNAIVKRPLWFAVPIIILLLIPYVGFSRFTQTNDIINQMPASTPSVQGYKLMETHFPAGELSPVYLLIESPGGDVTAPGSLQAINQIAWLLQSESGVTRVDYYSAPSARLATLAGQVRMTAIGIDYGSGTGDIAQLLSAGEELNGLALQYLGIVLSLNFQQVQAGLGEVRTLDGQISAADPADLPPLLAQLQSALNRLADSLQDLASEFDLAVESPFSASLLNTYFSIDRTAARINIALTGSPYAAETVDTIISIRKAIGESFDASSLEGSVYYLGGESAIRADIMITNDADFGVVVGAAIGGILLVIIILLRGLVAPLYMVATVLLNYGATLGITTLIFTGIMKQEGMIYMLPIFIFIVLVALGADYNIFLVSRIREESHQRPLKEAVTQALANTGGVITSCGIILAGTFATLMTSSLQMVMQIGAAIAIGVIIDTFVVRALLVPSIAALLGRWNWWPSRLKQNKK
jgi:putative drug exporter of the RND superfamily